MKESKWVASIASRLRRGGLARSLKVETGLHLAYGYEIQSMSAAPQSRSCEFETDLAIVEVDADGSWKPRVVMEAKINTVTTHDAITYGSKAASHRGVFPYLRYGVILGNRREFPLPGRLYRHGSAFDFMVSFRSFRPTTTEWNAFRRLVLAEIRASRRMEALLFDSRKRNRDSYTVLHRPLRLR